MVVCTLGDLLLDVVSRVGGPLVPDDDTPAETRTGAGGQAANVAAWVTALGARGRYLGKRASDAAGTLVATELRALGVELEGPVVDGKTGVVVSIVDPDGRRTMVSDRGVAAGLRPEEISLTWLAGADALHISGYALAREPIATAAERAAGLAHDAGIQVSVDVSSSSAVGESFADRLERIRPDVLFATEDEREALGRELPAREWVLKRGAAGCSFCRDGTRLELRAAPADVVDSTGAGDAVAAGYLLGGPLETAATRAMQAAARCVSKLGSMP